MDKLYIDEKCIISYSCSTLLWIIQIISWERKPSAAASVTFLFQRWMQFSCILSYLPTPFWVLGCNSKLMSGLFCDICQEWNMSQKSAINSRSCNFFFKFTELKKFVKKSRCIDIMDIRIFAPKIIMKIFWALKFKVRHFCDFHYLICWVLRNGTEMDLQINWPYQQTVQNVPNTFVEQKIHLMKIPKWPLGWYSVEVIWTMIWKAKISTVSRVKQ